MVKAGLTGFYDAGLVDPGLVDPGLVVVVEAFLEFVQVLLAKGVGVAAQAPLVPTANQP